MGELSLGELSSGELTLGQLSWASCLGRVDFGRVAPNPVNVNGRGTFIFVKPKCLGRVHIVLIPMHYGHFSHVRIPVAANISKKKVEK